MAKSPSVVVRVLGDTQQLGASFTTAGGKAQAAGKQMSGAFSGVIGTLNRTGVLGPFGTSLQTLADTMDNLQSHAKTTGAVMLGVGAGVTVIGGVLSTIGSKEKAAHQQLQAAVENTGHSYDEYGDRVDQAIKHQEHYGHTADETMNALQSLTQATNDPGKALQLLGTASDLAAAKHESLGEAAVQLSKTYGGSARLLKQFGIEMGHSGDKTKDHQKAVDELSKKLSGQAAASANTFTGKLAAMRAKTEDAAASLGQKVGPALQVVGLGLTAAGGAVEAFGALSSRAAKSTEAATEASKAAANGSKLAAAAQWLWNAAIAAFPIILIVVGIAAAVAAFILLYKHSQLVREVVADLGKVFAIAGRDIAKVVGDVVGFVEAHWKLLAAILLLPIAPIVVLIGAVVIMHKQITGFIGAVVDFVKDHWEQLAAILLVLLGPIGIVAAAFLLFRQQIERIVGDVLRIFAALPGGIVRALGDLGGLLIGAGIAVMGGLLNGIARGWGAVVSFLAGIGGAILRAVGNLGGVLVGAGQAVIGGLAAGISAAAGGLGGVLGGLGGRIAGAVGDLSGVLVGAGASVIRGLSAGIDSALGDVWNKVSSIAGKIASLKGPREVDYALLQPAGQSIMAGLAVGIESGFALHVARSLRGVTAAIGGAQIPGLTPSSAGTSSGATIGPARRSGPVVVIEQAIFTSELDVESFMRRVAWTAQTAAL